MPCCEGGGYYFKYFSAAIFLGSLFYNDISFVGSDDETEEPTKTPEPEDEQKTE